MTSTSLKMHRATAAWALKDRRCEIRACAGRVDSVADRDSARHRATLSLRHELRYGVAPLPVGLVTIAGALGGCRSP